jgi:hypothetical protein
MEVSGQLHGPAALLPGIPRYHWIAGLVGPRAGLHTVGTIIFLAIAGNWTLAAQPLPSRYTDPAIPAFVPAF